MNNLTLNEKWQENSDHFLTLTIREQYLIFLTGLVAVFFIVFYLFIDEKIITNQKSAQQIIRLQSSNRTLAISTNEMQGALQRHPNEEAKNKIAQYETKLAKVDAKLLELTSDLISPIQMRYALLDLLKFKKGVTLLSFELLGAEPLLAKAKPEPSAKSGNSNDVNSVNATLDTDSPQLNLYRHGIKIKLSGSYFDLRDYLAQLEKLSWKFFWQDFNFQLTEYPNNELEIEMYSLGTKKEFVGV